MLVSIKDAWKQVHFMGRNKDVCVHRIKAVKSKVAVPKTITFCEAHPVLL